MREVVIVEALRTAIGRREGALSQTRPDEVAAAALEELMNRSTIDPALVEDVVLGCVTQVGEQGWNIARLATLIAGMPVEVPAVTVNRMCGSGQQAIHFACQAILSGDIDTAIAGGVESMSRVKMGSDGKDFSPKLHARFDLVWQGTSAEMMAKKWNLTRSDLDEFSIASHQRALRAVAEGRFEKEIAPVAIGYNGDSTRFQRDEGPRTDTSLEKLNSLKPAFAEKGVVTAGNSSQISDGASVVLLMSREKAKTLGLKPRAKVVSRVVTGSDPILMLDGVIPATNKALSKANLTVADIDSFEINEAFACVPLAWAKELKPDMEKVNPNGGAIALGHPLGASGARLMTTLLHQLERIDGQFGLQTMCIGHGMATATVIERLSS
ncbi:MAG: thiolase family protein [Candidatus Obscuribacterales bacterium]|nr:thiolase family protein [Candidatus Obscuribacterales bacterium]